MGNWTARCSGCARISYALRQPFNEARRLEGDHAIAFRIAGARTAEDEGDAFLLAELKIVEIFGLL